MSLPIAIGIDDFRDIREQRLMYIDKSSLIKGLLDERGVIVSLFPRPRRFGKSVNLSMLRYFFEKRDEDLTHLFEDLSIWKAGPEYREHFQRHPVIFFNLKGTGGETFEQTWIAIREKIRHVFQTHQYLLEGLDALDTKRFRRILDGTAEQAHYERSLLDLCEWLHKHHGEKVVILMDEYDSPIHVAYVQGYAKKVLDFMRGFMGAALKSNPYLHRAVVTGILRVAKESLFSDVNNISVYSLLSKQFNTCYGFTESEVIALLEQTGQSENLPAVRAWYNGYLFGGEVIYNPWSILNYVHRREASPKPYWISTSSNDLVRELLGQYAVSLQPVFESLLAGESVVREIEENVVLNELHDREGALWSLLLFSGYLNATELPADQMSIRRPYRLSIPNLEVYQVYSTSFRSFLEMRLRHRGGSLDKFTNALLRGDAPMVERQLQAFVTDMLSYHDTGAVNADTATVDPEGIYHAFVLGLLAVMEPEYLVRSNRESGDGRPDVMIRPRDLGKPAALLEMKMAHEGKKTVDAALREAALQIRDRRYEAELLSGGASVVHAYAVAFDGKRVWIKPAAEVVAKKKKPVAKKKKAPPTKQTKETKETKKRSRS